MFATISSIELILFIGLIDFVRCLPVKVTLENDGQRLKSMFQRSHMQAIKNYYEQQALKMLGPGVSNSSHVDAIQDPVIPADLFKSSHQTLANGTETVSESDKTSENNEDESTVKKNIENNHDHYLHNDARQSSLFSAFRPPSLISPLGTTIPMNNLFRPPTLPSLPTLQLPRPAPRPPSPPKTSVIGNSGGPMALTNDNVIVVNVLSGNW